MACKSNAFVASLIVGLAVHALEYFGGFYRPCSRSALFSCAERQAALPSYSSRRNPRREFLDRPLLPARGLFPNVCQFQQDLRNPWRGHRSDGVAVLDRIRDAGRSGVEL